MDETIFCILAIVILGTGVTLWDTIKRNNRKWGENED